MHVRNTLISLAFVVARPRLLQLNVSNACKVDTDFFGKLTPKAQPVSKDKVGYCGSPCFCGNRGMGPQNWQEVVKCSFPVNYLIHSASLYVY